MCGIAGIVTPDALAYRSALDRMVGKLTHRGPDGCGAHLFSNCALGHTRLSIVDLKSGDQPMLAGDGRTAITFNGEIFGYREIKNNLPDYEFRTTSDTEVMLALYARYAEGMLRHLPGQFAFALWDERNQTLFAARDRFGEKPFYYAWGSRGEFVFASEIKSILASGLIKPKLNRAALRHYLQYLYIHPLETIYSNVFTLPPAHYLTVKNGKATVEKYWDLPKPSGAISEPDAIAEFKRLFEQSIERQLIADVPVAAFLSGGLDSSSVVAVASQKYAGLRTFSFGFRDSIDERPFARQIAEKYGTNHLELKDDGRDISDLMWEMARVYDEPFADSSNIPTYLISQAASRYGKVVITGDGGDELLAGYSGWYRPLWEMERAGRYPETAVALARWVAGISSRFTLPIPGPLATTAHAGDLRNQYSSITEAYAEIKKVFGDHELQGLGINGNRNYEVLQTKSDLKGSVDDAFRMDLSWYLPGDILVKTDRASMAHGLELRAPFLDVDLASFCISLPSSMKIRGSEDKWILRRAYETAWTDEIRKRGKCGFGAPVDKWLRQAQVADLKNRLLNNPGHALFSLIGFAASRAIVVADDYRTWTLLVLGLWLETGGKESL
jgi:asparagine synthase (glutamine-hydrolysing)